MALIQAFLLGIMVAWTPGLIVLAVLLRDVRLSRRCRGGNPGDFSGLQNPHDIGVMAIVVGDPTGLCDQAISFGPNRTTKALPACGGSRAIGLRRPMN